MNAEFPFRRAFFLAAFAATMLVGCDNTSDPPPETQDRDALIQQVYDLRQENAGLKNEIVVLNAEIGSLKHESGTESEYHARTMGFMKFGGIILGILLFFFGMLVGAAYGSRIKDRALADEAAAKDGTK